ncbi:MAG TPA: SCO family protein [Candidatus Aquilonibacter sp.]|nr:SCO family protein [Candidatus Aquilonibacter sp.]
MVPQETATITVNVDLPALGVCSDRFSLRNRNRFSPRNSFSAIALAFALIGSSLFAARTASAQAPVDTQQDNPSVAFSAQQKGALPSLFQGVGIQQHLGAQIPLDATFKDETGKDVTLSDYFGKKPVVLILAYYKCPMLCSLVLSGATDAFKASGFQLGDQFEALTVSFSPTETPALAAAAQKQYLHQYGVDADTADWHFLTGQQAQIQRLTSAVGFSYKYNPENGQYIHAAGIVVLTPAGKVSKYFYGVKFEPRDLHLALVQSSTNHIGSITDAVLLFCCQYDPSTGKYHAVITRVIDLACGFTVLVLGLGIFFLSKSVGKKQGPQPA